MVFSLFSHPFALTLIFLNIFLLPFTSFDQNYEQGLSLLLLVISDLISYFDCCEVRAWLL